MAYVVCSDGHNLTTRPWINRHHCLVTIGIHRGDNCIAGAVNGSLRDGIISCDMTHRYGCQEVPDAIGADVRVEIPAYAPNVIAVSVGAAGDHLRVRMEPSGKRIRLEMPSLSGSPELVAIGGL